MVRTTAILVMTIALAAGPAAAGQRNPRDPDRLSAGEVMRILDGYALVQAQEALQLGDAQYGTFVTRLRKLQETRRRHQQGRNQILSELRRLVGAQAGEPASEGTIREQVEALRAHDDKAAAEVRQAYDAIDQVLDTAQQARFRLFEESLERRKLDLIMSVRQGARGGS